MRMPMRLSRYNKNIIAMNNKLFFSEILPVEELVPAEMNAIVGGHKVKVGCKGDECSCKEIVASR